MANYRIYENGTEINTIVADEAFCEKYCTENGYTYELMPDPEPVPEPEPTIDERVTTLEEQLAETDEVAILLYEASLNQEAVNAEQDEAIIEIYETMEGLLNG